MTNSAARTIVGIIPAKNILRETILLVNSSKSATGIQNTADIKTLNMVPCIYSCLKGFVSSER